MSIYLILGIVDIKCFMHSGSLKEVEIGKNARAMKFVRGVNEDN